MSKKLTSHRCFLLALTLLSTFTAPLHAGVKPSKTSGKPDLQQYSSGKHTLSFSANSTYATISSQVLQVDFIGHKPVMPDSVTQPSTPDKAMPLNSLTYTNLWKGISLSFTGSSNGIYATTYELSPGTDVKNIHLHYHAPLTLGENKELHINLEKGSLTESAPVAWQIIEGKHVPVPVFFEVKGQEVGFALGTYNAAYALTIDPTLVWKP